MPSNSIFSGYLAAQQRYSERKRMGWIKIEYPSGYVLTEDDKKFIAAMKAEGEWGDPADRGPVEAVETGEFVNDKPIKVDFNNLTGE